MFYVDGVVLFGQSNIFAEDGRLAAALGSTAQAVADHLQSWDPDELVTSATEDVVDVLVTKGSVQCPRLLVADVYFLEPTETTQSYLDFGGRSTRRVPRFVLVAPFEGEKYVFTVRADQSSIKPPRVLRLKDHELHLYIDDPPDDAAKVKALFDQQIAKIEEQLDWSRRQIELHNRKIRDDVPGMVAKRREQLLATRSLQADIGYPVRRRSDADTYVAPPTRATIRPQRSSGIRDKLNQEPALSDEDFRAALQVIRHQRNALLHTPSLAAKVKEEQLRDLLLIGLNAHFEGGAAGELFGGEGRTDIVIGVEDRNLFVGECRIWSGPKTMDDALNKLFGYSMWRNTKAAILLFIRNVDVHAVIGKAITKIEKHPNHSRTCPSGGDDEYEFVMRATDEPARDIALTFIPFALRLSAEASAPSDLAAVIDLPVLDAVDKR
jgi:hypothetical protein